MILTETQRDLKRDLRTFKADYVSADAEDVIRALRKRQRGLNDQVNSCRTLHSLVLIPITLSLYVIRTLIVFCISDLAEWRHTLNAFHRSRQNNHDRFSSHLTFNIAARDRTIENHNTLLTSNKHFCEETKQIVHFPFPGSWVITADYTTVQDVQLERPPIFPSHSSRPQPWASSNKYIGK